MSDKNTKEKGRDEATTEGRQDFAEMCRTMMSGETSGCCGPEMRTMMSRMMAEFQAKQEK
jgi:bacterioferritin-associated ferredoxin